MRSATSSLVPGSLLAAEGAKFGLPVDWLNPVGGLSGMGLRWNVRAQRRERLSVRGRAIDV